MALTGFFHSVVKTSGGTSLSTSFRISSSRPCGRPDALQFGVVEVAGDADVLVVEQVLVDLLEVEGESEGLAHARVLELLAALIEDERLHRRDALERQRFLLDQPFLTASKSYCGGPALGAGLGPEVELAGLEGLEGRHAVAEVDVA